MPTTYDRKIVCDAVREHVFAGHMTEHQVAGLEAILNAWERLQPEGDPHFLADMLGTTKWETASTMQPIEEYGHGRGRAYGTPAGPWHQVYDGRGLVQDTWYANYAKQDPKLHALGVLEAGESIVRTPTLVMRPDVAAAIMIYGMIEGWFTGKKLADYYGTDRCDWTGSRRIINGIDHAAEIGALKQSFYKILVDAHRSERPASPVPSAGLIAQVEPSLAKPPMVAPTSHAVAAAKAPAVPSRQAPAPKPSLLARFAAILFSRSA